MPYASLPTVVTPNPITEAWGNQVKANFDAGPNGLATTSGQIPYATGAGALAMLAPGPTPLAVLRLNAGLAAPEWWPIPVDPVTTVPGLRTLGPGAQQAAPGNDARLSDARPPTGAAGGALAGTYPSPTLAPGAIGTAQIADGAVTAAKIADANVTTGKLVAGGVYPINISGTAAGAPPTGPAGGSLAGSYPNPTLAAASVGTSQLVDSSVTSAKLVSGGTYPINVTGSAGSAGTSGSAPPSGAAGGSLAGSYPNPSLAANSVAAAQIVDGTVGTAELADGNVTNAKLVAGATYTIHITGVAGGAPPTGAAGGSLAGIYPSPSIAAGAVGTAQIVDGTVTPAKLVSSGTYPIHVTGNAGSASVASSVAAGVVGTAGLANHAVTGVKLEDLFGGGLAQGNATTIPTVQIDTTGRIISLTSQPVALDAGTNYSCNSLSVATIGVGQYVSTPYIILGIGGPPSGFLRCPQGSQMTATAIGGQRPIIGTDASYIYFADPQTSMARFGNGQIDFFLASQAYFSFGVAFYPVGPAATQSLGLSSNRWTTVYATNGTINTSSRAAKRLIRRVDPAAALALVERTPIYAFNYRTGDRAEQRMRKIGFLAEEAGRLLNQNGHGADPQVTASVALAAIQELARRLDELGARVEGRAA